jgi:hypothetical protein
MILKKAFFKSAAIIMLSGLFTGPALSGQCTSASNSAGTAVSSSFTGSSISFSSPLSILTSDNNRASAAALISLLEGQTEYLKATNFGFSIPASATICGIGVSVEKSATGIGNVLFLESYVTDNSVRLVKNNVVTGNNKATSTHWGTTDVTASYGGNGDSWGVTLLPADINNSNFGVAFSADVHGLVALIPSARVDHINITVYYIDALLPVRETRQLPHEEKAAIKVYPNPFSDYIQIAGISTGDRIAVTDTYGRQISLTPIPGGSTSIRLPLAGLQPGMYVVTAGKAKMKIQKL